MRGKSLMFQGTGSSVGKSMLCAAVLRILRQDGAFLLSGLDTDEADSDRKLRKHVLKELRIPAGCKAAIVQQLERVNIHQASLFPEPDTVAQYLRRK